MSTGTGRSSSIPSQLERSSTAETSHPPRLGDEERMGWNPTLSRRETSDGAYLDDDMVMQESFLFRLPLYSWAVLDLNRTLPLNEHWHVYHSMVTHQKMDRYL